MAAALRSLDPQTLLDFVSLYDPLDYTQLYNTLEDDAQYLHHLLAILNPMSPSPKFLQVAIGLSR